MTTRAHSRYRWSLLVVVCVGSSGLMHACATDDLEIGNDIREADGSVTPIRPDAPDGADSEEEAGLDASTNADVTMPPCPAECLSTLVCAAPRPGACPTGDVCCCRGAVFEPVCEGGIAARFGADGCPSEYLCAPITCAVAGGVCSVPGSCKHPALVGDPALYLCASGGDCCLP